MKTSPERDRGGAARRAVKGSDSPYACTQTERWTCSTNSPQFGSCRIDRGESPTQNRSASQERARGHNDKKCVP
eukprot:32780-Eustigmatos_ZCMA.PRE.1